MPAKPKSRRTAAPDAPSLLPPEPSTETAAPEKAPATKPARKKVIDEVAEKTSAHAPAASASSTNVKRLFLVDAMGYIFRAFYAPMDALQTSAGVPTKVPYLFATMMRRLFKNKDLRPDHLAVVFDHSAPTFRDKLFDAYKAQRAPMPDQLSIQIPFVRRYCAAMHLPILEYPGYEADDVIASLARQGAAQGLEVIVVTSDKDLLQLVDENVRLLIPTKGDLLVDREKVIELMGVPPEQVPDVMALMGDSIDNIPGARDPNEKLAPGERRKPGIGDVGARQLIQQFGSAEEALARASEVKRSNYREALEKYGEFVKLSKQLSKIPLDAPVELSLEKLQIREPDPVALRDLYTELGFTTLIKELAPVVDDRAVTYTALESPADLKAFLDAIPAGKEAAVWLSLDSEEPDDEGFGTRVLGIEISTEPGTAHFIANDVENRTLGVMRDYLADPSRPKIVHDPKLFNLLCSTGSHFTNSSSSGHGFSRAVKADQSGVLTPEGRNEMDSTHSGDPLPPVANIKHATILYSYLVRSTTANHVFAEVVLRHLNRTLSGAPGEHADFLLRLAPVLRAEVERLGLEKLYDEIDFPLSQVLSRMECVGVRVDRQELDVISTRAQQEISRLEKSIYELAGFEFKINSPQQLAEVLFDRLGLQMPRRGRFTKGRSTAADVLEELALVHEMPKKVLEYRELAKLKSTYADVLPRLIHPVSQRLHTRFDQTGTATGRLSSANPNLQNIPIRTEIGREIRAAFVASPGQLLLSADYSQIELRILAHLSEDPILTQAFRQGEDIHSRTAQEVFGVLPLEQTREHRRVAKVINFGVIYGLSPFGLAQNLGIDQKEAAQFIAQYFERYAGVKKYLDKQIAETRKLGYTKTIFGRIRPMPEITSPQVSLRNFAERTAMNTPMQGAAADLIKLAMIEADRRLPAERFEAKMILQVHDELLFEAPQDEIPRLRTLVKDVMEGVYKLRVPLLVETKVGPNWRDMK